MSPVKKAAQIKTPMKLPDAPTDHAPTDHAPTDHAPQISGQRKPTDHLCSAKEAAEILRAPLPTIYYLTKNNKLPAIRIGGRWRFRRSDLKAMVNSPSMFSKRERQGASTLSDNRDLAKSIARAISNAQASQTTSGTQPLTVCVVIVSPTSNGGFEVLPLDRVEPMLNEPLTQAA